jgi:hypothetical protein
MSGAVPTLHPITGQVSKKSETKALLAKTQMHRVIRPTKGGDSAEAIRPDIAAVYIGYEINQRPPLLRPARPIAWRTNELKPSARGR